MKDYLNINEAATATGLSIPTIRAKLEKGLLPGASQIQEGKRKLWRIPFTDLIAAGLIDKVSTNESQAEKESLINYETEIRELRRELEVTQELLRRADQTLEEYRQRERNLFIPALETKQAQERRRSLWQRLTGN